MPKMISTIINVILTGFDIVSDFILAVDYCVTDNPWWCGLTWAFIVGPLLGGIGVLVLYCRDDFNRATSWKGWKALELSLEAGPQLLLQLYILALAQMEPTSISGNILLWWIFFKEKSNCQMTKNDMV